MIKIFEKFKEIYKTDTDKPVVIRDEFISVVDFINIKSFSVTKERRPDYLERQEFFTGLVGTFEYQYDDFFSTVTFPDVGTWTIPSYMLINKDEYDFNKAIKQYNL